MGAMANPLVAYGYDSDEAEDEKNQEYDVANGEKHALHIFTPLLLDWTHLRHCSLCNRAPTCARATCSWLRT